MATFDRRTWQPEGEIVELPKKWKKKMAELHIHYMKCHNSDKESGDADRCE